MSTIRAGLTVSLTLAALMSAHESVLANFIQIDPRRSYLDNPNPTGLPALPIDLAPLGIVPGDTVHLKQMGAYCFFSSGTPDNVTRMLGVFSSSNVLLPYTTAGNSLRVPGALSTTRPQQAWPFTGGDIPQDFYITEFDVVVPPTAAFLFIDSMDTVYYDNTDPNNDYGIMIKRVPEPAASALLGIVFALTRRRRAP